MQGTPAEQRQDHGLRKTIGKTYKNAQNCRQSRVPHEQYLAQQRQEEVMNLKIFALSTDIDGETRPLSPAKGSFTAFFSPFQIVISAHVRLASIARTICALALLLAVSCSSPVITPVLTTLTVTLPSVTTTPGLTQTATASGIDQNGTAIATGTIAWSSGTPSVATVDATSGQVSALTLGTTAIIATSGSIIGQKSLTVVTSLQWPGTDDVHTVDGLNVFKGNLSGLIYEDLVPNSSAVLWGVRNGPSTLYRLIFSGGIWTPDPDLASSWGTGKGLRYTDGTGAPDSEGVTYSQNGSAGGIYVSTERDGSSAVSRLSVLRFDPSQAGTTLTATNDWNLTSDLPTVGSNLGLEAITYVPDAFLVAQGFFDEAAAHAYNPAEYANHGSGLYFVGLEANGMIYAYALNHVTNGFTRVATISSGFAAVMDLQFDRELNYLWAICDDGCGGQSATLEVNTTVGSPTKGRFQITHVFARSASMPNLNNEGFALATQSTCVAGFKPVFWSDDGETGGHSIRQASLPCVRFP